MYQLSIKRLSSCFALALLLVAAGCAGPKPSITDASSAVVTVPPAAQRQYEEALEWMEAGEFEAAAVQFDAFVQRYPNYAGAYINLAIINVKLERDDEALLLLDDALKIDSSNAAALNQLGVIKRRSGDFVGAENAWRAAIAAHPDYAYAWYNLGVLYDLYLQDLRAALLHYQTYQNLTRSTDGDVTVERWIVDLQNRIGAPPQTARIGDE